MDIDVDDLLDDVDKVVKTHHELSCMSLGKLKSFASRKAWFNLYYGLSTKGKMTKLFDRYLVAQANGFSTKREPTKRRKEQMLPDVRQSLAPINQMKRGNKSRMQMQSSMLE